MGCACGGPRALVEGLLLEGMRRHEARAHEPLHRRFGALFPAVGLVSAADFGADAVVDARREAKSQLKIVDCQRHLGRMRRLAAAGRDEWQATVDGLLADLLPHVRVGPRRVALEDCKVIDLIDQPGAYFPSIHTDIEWDTYLSDGFQVWYLVHNEEPGNRGNMFVFETDRVPTSSSSTLRLEGDRLEQVLPSAGPRGPAAPVDASELRARYLDMRPGECLVMGQRLYHMSDFRVPRPRRRAVNFRVAVAPEGLRVAWGPWSPDSCLNRWRARRCRRGRGAGGEELIYPGRYDLAA